MADQSFIPAHFKDTLSLEQACTTDMLFVRAIEVGAV